MPLLPAPPNIWQTGIELGEMCYDHKLIVNSMDLLIAALCLHHEATLLTFDTHFQQLAEWSDLQVELLARPD